MVELMLQISDIQCVSTQESKEDPALAMSSFELEHT